MEEWKTPVQVEGRVRRDGDGFLVEETEARLLVGCLIAPGQFTVPGLLSSPTSEQADEQATLYMQRGSIVNVGETIIVPSGHLLAGRWQVESPPSPWPRGVAVTISRR